MKIKRKSKENQKKKLCKKCDFYDNEYCNIISRLDKYYIRDNISSYYYSEGGGFMPGPDFGCIHFKAKKIEKSIRKIVCFECKYWVEKKDDFGICSNPKRDLFILKEDNYETSYDMSCVGAKPKIEKLD